jgi:hypothetical protein
MGARLIFNGDLADFITVKDPRYNKAKDKAVLAGIINEQIEFVVDFLTPYVDDIDLIGIGNHEDVLIKHYGIDALRFVLRDLNRIREERKLPPIHYGSYRGFMVYRFKAGKKISNLVIMRHHGGGGNAPVTGGAIDLYRLMTGFDADLYFVGHKHKATYREEPIVKIKGSGAIYQKMRKAIMTPGFQEPLNISDFDLVGGECSYEDKFYNTNPTGWGLVEIRPRWTTISMELDWTVTLMGG